MGRLDSMVSINLNLRNKIIEYQSLTKRIVKGVIIVSFRQDSPVFYIYMFLHLIILVGLEMFEDLM